MACVELFSFSLFLLFFFFPHREYQLLGRYSGYFDGFDRDEISDIISLPEPEICPREKRRLLMDREDLLKFDAAHFVADFFEDDAIKSLSQWRAWWEGAPAGSTQEVGSV